jgi:FkbM family methyltransferase
MELYHHPNPLFTKWIVAEGLLQEAFVVIDVGCQGGEHARWGYLRDYLDFHGFDPIPEAIDSLQRENAGRPNRHYYNIAFGNEDGQRLFHVASDTFSSSFFGAPEPAGQSGDIATGSRLVKIRKLDTLFAAGEIPNADHIKLDCEGFEPEILIGGRQYLQSSGVLSAVVETNYNLSPSFPNMHFVAVVTEVVKHRLVVGDYSFDRVAQQGYARALSGQPWPAPAVRNQHPSFVPGSPATHNFLFCRDFVRELQHPDHYVAEVPTLPLTVDRVIKAMIGFELHGLMDWAYAHAETFVDLLASRLDVERAKRLLLVPPRELRYSPDLVKCLQMIDQLRVLLFACEADEPRPLSKVPTRALVTELQRRLRRRVGLWNG